MGPWEPSESVPLHHLQAPLDSPSDADTSDADLCLRPAPGSSIGSKPRKPREEDRLKVVTFTS
jgi:hypothetical protein